MRTLEISIPYRSNHFFGELSIPEKPLGIVIFSIDSASTRWDVQYRIVAEYANQHHLATLLIDHSSAAELTNGNKIVDISQLADRLVNTIMWTGLQSTLTELPIGLYAAGTGAAVAFRAAAILGAKIKGIVTKNGNPFPVMHILPQVISPTLMLIGEYDHEGLAMNRLAMNEICGEKSLKVIPGAGTMFNRKSKLGEVAERTVGWFHIYMGQPTFIQVE